MIYVSIVTSLMLIQLFYFAAQTGKARGKYGVNGPAVTGHEMFERHYRVHYNTLEQLILIVPSMWLFAMHVHELAAAGFGVVYLIGRFIYASAYVKDPASRGLGFGLSILPTAILMLGSLIGATIKLF